VFKDNVKAFRFLKEDINCNVPDANYTWANILYNYALVQYPDEQTIIANRREAVRYYEAAAKADHGRALYELSYCYLLGHGVTQNTQRAEELAFRAAQHGFYSEVFDDIYHAAEIHKRPNETFVNRIRERSFAAYSLADYSQLESIIVFIGDAIKVSRNYYFYLFLVRADLLVKLYRKTQKTEHLEQALKDVNIAFNHNPLLMGFASAYHTRAECYFYLGKYEQAHEAINDAKLLDFGHHDKYDELGKRCRIEVQRVDREKALRLQEKRQAIELRLAEGKTKLDAKSYEEALKIFAEVVSDNPTYAKAHYFHGMALKNLNRTEEALKSLSEALRLKPSYSDACCAIALLNHTRIKKLQETSDKLRVARLAYSGFKKLLEDPKYSKAAKEKVEELDAYIKNISSVKSTTNSSITVANTSGSASSAFFKDLPKPTVSRETKYIGSGPGSSSNMTGVNSKRG
ncbi:MAG: tetratricopeptide repeat protein, partial [Gammaproteobacteria bacterium]